MDSEQQRLENDIQLQRRRVGDDVDALVEKVSPGQVARRQVGRVRGAASSARRRVMGHDSDASGPGLRDRASDAGHSVADSAAGARDSLAGAKDATADAVSSTADAARHRTEGNPIAAGLIVFGVGWLASSLLPASKVERQAGAALREHAEEPVRQAGQQLGDKAKEVADHLREPAQEAVGSVKQSAAHAATQVKERAGAHSDRLSDEARDRTGSVRDSAAHRSTD